MREGKKNHWEQVYQNKTPGEISWTQNVPQTSIDLIKNLHLNKTAKIIDVGGGDSKLVDYLIGMGYQDITVLDISEAALKRSQLRLGNKSSKVKWIASDITEFKTNEHYDLWHDRATFHFLTKRSQVAAYLHLAGKAISKFMVIATFSENGPEKCSGLPVRHYSEDQLEHQLEKDFDKIRCITVDHTTPFQTTQNFLFCSFKRKGNNLNLNTVNKK